jgi:tetratricopeptide (TPR) repeat protein
MARDPRRDHGFIIPDPLLTKEFGIPNACNRCHTNENETVEWAIEWTDTWYGEKMNRRTRRRARAVARAQAYDETVVPELIALLADEEIPAWRSVLVSMLGSFNQVEGVRPHLEKALAHERPLVRSAAVRALRGQPGAEPLVMPLRKDPVRLVRLDAAMATLRSAQWDAPGHRELMRYLDATCDQPAGAARQSEVALAEGRAEDAEFWMRRAADWDQSSPAVQQMLGRVLNMRGKNREAEQFLRKAEKLDPENPDHPYTLALLYAEMGRPGEAVKALQKAVKLDPEFGRAWYNLGLGYAQAERLDDALKALTQAQRLLAESPDPPYAAATIYLRKGDVPAARRVVQESLKRAPDYQPALNLLRQIEAMRQEGDNAPPPRTSS